MKFISNVPEDAGKVVGMVSFQDRIIIACEYMIYEITDDGIKPIEYRNLYENPST